MIGPRRAELMAAMRAPPGGGPLVVVPLALTVVLDFADDGSCGTSGLHLPMAAVEQQTGIGWELASTQTGGRKGERFRRRPYAPAGAREYPR